VSSLIDIPEIAKHIEFYMGTSRVPVLLPWTLRVSNTILVYHYIMWYLNALALSVLPAGFHTATVSKPSPEVPPEAPTPKKSIF